MTKIIAKKRSKTEKLGDIRSNGMIPAVVYGARVENTLISVSSIDFAKVFKEAGETSTILLEIPNDKDLSKKIGVDVLIHDIQKDPVKDFPIHIDFLAVDMNKTIEVNVPLEFTGIAPAEKSGFGTLIKVLHEVEIEALPKDTPHSLEVDISKLENLGDQIHAKDIALPTGVTLLTDSEEVVALITAIKEEEVAEETVDLSSIEVEKKGKKEEEGAETDSKN